MRRPPRFLLVFADDVPNLLNMLPRILDRPLGGSLAMVETRPCLECACGAGLRPPAYLRTVYSIFSQLLASELVLVPNCTYVRTNGRDGDTYLT